MRILEHDTDYAKLVGRDGFSIVLFGTSLCGACAALAHKIDLWLEDHPGIEACYISVDDHLELASQNRVLTAPTLLVFHSGKLFLETAGVFGLDDFLAKFERYLELSA